MDDSEDVYRHNSLDSDRLRLLRFETASKSIIKPDNRCPRLLIEDCLRREAPPYRALSYEWGEPTTDLHTIRLNGRTFKARANLWWCLRHMQRLYDDRHIWIDALCIDQHNIQERNEQVRNMGEVYSSATSVLVWLGLRHDAERAEKELQAGNTLKAAPKPLLNKHVIRKSYWTRLWIVQELLLARRIEMLCGMNVIQWETQAEYIKFSINYGGWDNDFIFHRIIEDALVTEVDQRGREHLSLAEVLWRYGHSQCEDPRDKLFALLNILPADERAFLSQWFPDYAVPAEKVQLLLLAYLRMFAPKAQYRDKPDKAPLRQHIAPSYIGVESLEFWHTLISKTETHARLGETRPEKLWTPKFATQLLLQGRPRSAFKQRKQKIEQRHREWIDSCAHALHNLAISE